jgi:titin
MRLLAGVVMSFVACFAHAGTVLSTVSPVDAYYTSLQLSAGNPVISYFDGTNQELRLATCAANCATATPTWVIAPIDTAGTYFFSSLQLNGGNPVVSYLDAANGDLKLATCTAGCQTSTPTWALTTVDSPGNVGSFDSLQLNGGNPVIAYSDTTNLTLKLATCTANCQTATPTWVITTVDNAGNVGAYASMQLNGGNPVISYYDATNFHLKLATCTAGCTTATPTWVITTVDSATDVGYSTSLQINGGNPVISYFDSTGQNLKLATCTAGCQTATPTWVITTAAAGANVGDTSLQLNGGNPVIAYSEQNSGTLKLATCTANCQSATPTWTISTVDSSMNVGRYLSMQLIGGAPAISYRDDFNGALKLAMSTPPPSVTSIVRAGTDPTAAASVSYTVTFSESVTGVDATDFALTATGTLAGASVTSVTGSGTTWTVTVATGTGSGTLRLDLVDDDSIVGTAPLGGPGAGNGNFTAGQVYTFNRTPPAIVAGLAMSAPAGGFTTGNVIDMQVQYDSAITVDTTGGTPSLAYLIGGNTRNAAYFSGSGTTTLTFRYTVQASDQDLDGIDYACSIALNGGTLRDSLGNDAALSTLRVCGHFTDLVNSDVTPNAFSFNPVGPQALSSLVTSNTITISGIDFPVAISITGGAYSIGCTGTFTTAPGTIANGDTVCVQLTTSASFLTAATTTLTVGGVSGTFSATTRAANPPAQPVITSVTPGNGQATVVFTTVSDLPIASYRLTCNGVLTSAGASPYTITGLTNGTAYNCTLVVVDNSGSFSPPSAQFSFTPLGVPGAPTIGAATPGNGQATIAFSAPASDGGSFITRYTATCGAFSASGLTASPITVIGLTNGTPYSCSVIATNAQGDSLPSASVSVTPAAATVPGAPTIASATPGIGQVTLVFGAPASNGGSPITKYTASCVSGSTYSISGPGSPLTITGIPGGTTYSCSVIATNAVGDGPASASVSVTPGTAAPGAPTITSITPGSGTATIVFTPPASNGGSPITRYTATCTSSGIPPTVVATGTASPITLTGMWGGGTGYSCSVFATNAVGNGPSSNSMPVGITIGVPTFPFSVTATPGDRQAIISFSAAGSNGLPITSYTATCTASGVPTATASGTASPITVTGLVNGTDYTCSVTATNSAGTGPAGFSGLVTPLGVPGAPTLTTLTPSNGQLRVDFLAPASDGGSGITEYTVSCAASGAPLTATGTVSPITLTGFGDNLPYSCRVTATNDAGTGPASNTMGFETLGGIQRTSLVFTFPAGSTCALNSAQLSPAPTNTNLQFKSDLINLDVTCPGSNQLDTFRATFLSDVISALGLGARYVTLTSLAAGSSEAGPPNLKTAPQQWAVMPAAVSGNTVTVTITDGGLGDSDGSVNHTIVHVGGLVAAAADVQQVPTLSEWAQILMGLLLVGSGAWAMRKRG